MIWKKLAREKFSTGKRLFTETRSLQRYLAIFIIIDQK